MPSSKTSLGGSNNNNHTVPFLIAVLVRVYGEAILHVDPRTMKDLTLPSLLAPVAISPAALANDVATLRSLCSDTKRYPTVQHALTELSKFRFLDHEDNDATGGDGVFFVTDAGEAVVEMLLPARARLFKKMALPLSWGAQSLTSPHDIVSLLHRFNSSSIMDPSFRTVVARLKQDPSFPSGDTVHVRWKGGDATNSAVSLVRMNSEDLDFSRALRFTAILRSCHRQGPPLQLDCCKEVQATGSCKRGIKCLFVHCSSRAPSSQNHNFHPDDDDAHMEANVVDIDENEQFNNEEYAEEREYDENDDAALDAADLDALAEEQEARNGAALIPAPRSQIPAPRSSETQTRQYHDQEQQQQQWQQSKPALNLASSNLFPQPLIDIMMLRLMQLRHEFKDGWSSDADVGQEFAEVKYALYPRDRQECATWKELRVLLAERRVLKYKVVDGVHCSRLNPRGAAHVLRIFGGYEMMLSSKSRIPSAHFMQHLPALQRLSVSAANSDGTTVAPSPNISAATAAPPPPTLSSPDYFSAAPAAASESPQEMLPSDDSVAAAAYASMAEELRLQLRQEREEHDKQQAIDSQEKQEMSLTILKLRAQVDDMAEAERQAAQQHCQVVQKMAEDHTRLQTQLDDEREEHRNYVVKEQAQRVALEKQNVDLLKQLDAIRTVISQLTRAIQ